MDEAKQIAKEVETFVKDCGSHGTEIPKIENIVEYLEAIGHQKCNGEKLTTGKLLKILEEQRNCSQARKHYVGIPEEKKYQEYQKKRLEHVEENDLTEEHILMRTLAAQTLKRLECVNVALQPISENLESIENYHKRIRCLNDAWSNAITTFRKLFLEIVLNSSCIECVGKEK